VKVERKEWRVLLAWLELELGSPFAHSSHSQTTIQHANETMSSTLNTDKLPAPANKVGGVRTSAPHKYPNKDDSLTPQTNVETALGRGQPDLATSLGLPSSAQPTPPVRDQFEHGKANASTFPTPPRNQGKVQGRTNANRRSEHLTQPGGAFAANRQPRI